LSVWPRYCFPSQTPIVAFPASSSLSCIRRMDSRPLPVYVAHRALEQRRTSAGNRILLFGAGHARGVQRTGVRCTLVSSERSRLSMKKFLAVALLAMIGLAVATRSEAQQTTAEPRLFWRLITPGKFQERAGLLCVANRTRMGLVL
jgi:hypothetical protein